MTAQESLIERAARVYDFGAHLTARAAQPLPWERAVVAEVPCSGERRNPEPGATTVVVDDNPGLLPSQEHEENTLAAIPAEFLSDSDDDGMEPWDGPLPGIAAIDRTMLAEKGMLVPGAPVGALAEEFRLVKRQLLLTARAISDGLEKAPDTERRARTILVGSGKPGEGKTFCAINLAISLAAERDVEIVLVDADFAKPDIMASLGLTHTPEDSPGLLDVLADPAIDPETCIIRTDVPQLSLLPAGKRSHSDTELLASARTARVLDRLLEANPARIIVFDTPPTLAASPASVLALLVGQVMLVVRADRTTEADVHAAVQLLDGCDEIHLVLNAVAYEPGRGRFGSYYGQGE
ncbi:AAA family ATPase [Sphingomonas adhaesiva]|uniref:AAA family ATPase n=1 Tax=Sphingomonas adhaesiva TaxID=28212 RepID=UPI002FFBA7BD